MDSMIFWTLVVDGVVNGTIYALLAIGLVLVFVVTRVILLPQGVYVSFAALTLSQFQRGNVPGLVADRNDNRDARRHLAQISHRLILVRFCGIRKACYRPSQRIVPSSRG